MCVVCGCGGDGATIVSPNGQSADHHHHHDHGHQSHDAAGPAHSHAPGLDAKRMIEIETDILSKNDRFAARNRARLAEEGAVALNLVSSPGSGKTTLLCATIAAIGARWPVAVIEGDQQTSNDADRIRAAGAPAVQVNTGKGCHLDAHMVGHAFEHFSDLSQRVLFIENVGNLVCPAAFDLGEVAKVAVLSVTEGEDKPIKYPDMFAASRLMILNKIDLAPHVDFDIDACEAYARRVNPEIEILRLSARTGEGMQAWLDWIAQRRADALEAAAAAAEAKGAALKAAADAARGL
ncbi:MAG: hydrogenase nickel incorporation protein HypB [Pseudomonadota bacterium]